MNISQFIQSLCCCGHLDCLYCVALKNTLMHVFGGTYGLLGIRSAYQEWVTGALGMFLLSWLSNSFWI